MSVRRLVAGAAVPLLLAGLLAGCGSEESDAAPQPKLPEPTSSSPEPSATPEEESPEDFIRRWQAASDDMQANGETSEFRSLSKGCVACADFAETVESIYEEGGSIEFAGSKIVSVQRLQGQPPTLEMRLGVPETRIFRSGSASPEVMPGNEMGLRVTLGRVDGSWVVTHYGIL